jgi:hypothetical protein
MDFASHRDVVSGWLSENSDALVEEERLNLYVTGLSPLLVAFLEGWTNLNLEGVSLKLMHWDREEETYLAQTFDTSSISSGEWVMKSAFGYKGTTGDEQDE